MIWYVFAFLYFIFVDVLIFTQRWTMLVIALVSGAIFGLIALLLRGIFSDKKGEAAGPSAQPAFTQPQSQPLQNQQVYQPGPTVIDRTTQFAPQQKQDEVNIPAVFFYTELFIVIALGVIVCLK